MYTPSDSKTEKYIGYRKADYATPYSKFYDEPIAPLPAHVIKALGQAPYPAGSLPPFEKAPELLEAGYRELETGYTREPDGSACVAVLTAMPGVSPDMWDWWFGWHGSLANRYKLWHPKAHQHAEWKDGNQKLVAYVGRISMIEEYIGKKMEKANIRFIDPAELGFNPQKLENNKQVAVICARVGLTHFPLDIGWLVHQVRATEGGAEMRSRFWIGGRHIQLRAKGILLRFISKMLQKLYRLPEGQAGDLLTHCAEEMNHLAGFLPRLYSEHHP